LDHAIWVVPYRVRTRATDLVLRFRGCVMRLILLGTPTRTTESIFAWQGAPRCAAGRGRNRIGAASFMEPLTARPYRALRRSGLPLISCRRRKCRSWSATGSVEQEGIRVRPRRAAQRTLARLARRPHSTGPAPSAGRFRQYYNQRLVLAKRTQSNGSPGSTKREPSCQVWPARFRREVDEQLPVGRRLAERRGDATVAAERALPGWLRELED